MGDKNLNDIRDCNFYICDSNNNLIEFQGIVEDVDIESEFVEVLDNDINIYHDDNKEYEIKAKLMKPRRIINE